MVGFNLIGGLSRDETAEVHTTFLNPLGRLSAIWIESCPAPGKEGALLDMSEKEMIAHSGRVNNDQLLTPNASKRFQELKIRRSRGPDTKRFQRWDKSQQTRPNSLVAQLGLSPVIRL